MRWIGLFNIGYGALGMAAAIYLGRMDAILLCLWVMSSGFILRSRLARAFMRRLVGFLDRPRGVLILDATMRVSPVL